MLEIYNATFKWRQNSRSHYLLNLWWLGYSLDFLRWLQGTKTELSETKAWWVFFNHDPDYFFCSLTTIMTCLWFQTAFLELTDCSVWLMLTHTLLMAWYHYAVEAHLWSCSAGPQCSRIWSSSSRRQRFTGLSGWGLHKYRPADVCGPETRAASCTAWPKHRVELSWGRLEESIKKYTQTLRLNRIKKKFCLHVSVFIHCDLT